MIATDGTINGRKHNYLQLSQMESAEFAMKMLSEEFRRPLYLWRRNLPRKNQWIIKFLGFPINWKTEVPMMSLGLERHYVRGLIDGDGCISKRSNGKKNVRLLWNDSQHFIGTFFLDFLSRNKILHTRISKIYGNVNHCPIKESDVQVFLDLIYQDSIIFLPRKKELANFKLL